MNELPIQLSQASGVPFYRQIYDQITDYIRSGRLPPNTLLPSVRELAAQLLVSSITVRRTYSDLEHSGLIVRRQGLGTFVAEEVAEATRSQARAEAQEVLNHALNRAQQLGMSMEEIQQTVESFTGLGGDDESGSSD